MHTAYGAHVFVLHILRTRKTSTALLSRFANPIQIMLIWAVGRGGNSACGYEKFVVIPHGKLLNAF